MAHLRPCDGCLRHVRANETRCPFCDHALAIDTHTPVAQPSRLGRAARMAFGAAVATASLAAACGGGNKPPETSGASAPTGGELADAAPAVTAEPTSTASAAPTSTETPPPPPNPAKPYGAPPADGLLV